MTARRSYLRLVARGMTTAAVGSVAGCADGSGSDSDTRTVKMVDLAFSPGDVTVAPGTTVRWINASEIEHTVTAYGDGIPDDADYFASGGFGSEQRARSKLSAGLVGPGETYRHAFERTGVYRYYCIPHEGSGMEGGVRVSR